MPKQTHKQTPEQLVTDIIKTEKPKMSPRGGNSPVIGDNGVMMEMGDASKVARTIMHIIKNDGYFGDIFASIETEADIETLSGTQLDKDNIDSMKRRFVGFVGYCMMNDVRFGNKTAYAAIGIDKDDVYNWENKRTRTDAHSEFIKKVRDFCGAYRELLGAAGLINPVTLVWWQKNYDGLVDRTEHVITPGTPLGDTLTPEEIQSKYQDMIEE